MCVCLLYLTEGKLVFSPRALRLSQETHSFKFEIIINTKNLNPRIFFYTTTSNQSLISRRGLSNCYVKGSFASEVHRERIGRSLCVTLYAAWLQFAVKRPRPLASPSYLPSLVPGACRVSRCRAYHGYVYVLVSDTYGDQTEYTER